MQEIPEWLFPISSNGLTQFSRSSYGEGVKLFKISTCTQKQLAFVPLIPPSNNMCNFGVFFDFILIGDLASKALG